MPIIRSIPPYVSKKCAYLMKDTSIVRGEIVVVEKESFLYFVTPDILAYCF